MARVRLLRRRRRPPAEGLRAPHLAGGRYTVDNVVPACRSCNASKCNSEVTGWMRRKRLDEESFLIRQWEVAAKVVAEAAR